MGFKKKLMEELEGELEQSDLKLLPGGFQTLGKVIIIKLKPELMNNKEIIGEAYLKLLPYIRSVYLNRGKIEGDFRTPEQIEYLSGEKDPIVEHKEHGVIYNLDITKIMFSQGNLRERKHLASLVKKDEIVVDMFAGIGYFSLPIGKLSDAKKVYSIELNPLAFQYLKENVKLNDLEGIIEPILGDSKEEVLKLSKEGVRADRIIMGVFPAPKNFIPEALSVAKEDGATFHYEGVRDEEEFMSLFNEFDRVAKAQGFTSRLKSHRFVKSYGPHLYHVVMDILVSRP